MARISGIDIPREKRVIASLRYIHGIGAKRADDICTDLKIDPITRVSNLTNDEVAQIRKYIEANFRVEGDLEEMYHKILEEKLKLVHIKAQGIEKAFQLEVKGLIQMQGQEKVLGLQ